MRRRFLILAMLGLLVGLPAGEAHALRSKKKPLSEKDMQSAAFLNLQRVSQMGILDLRLLYETSQARNFKEFARALMVAYILKLDHQLVLRALGQGDLDEVLKNFGIPRQRAKAAKKQARKELDWKPEDLMKRGR